MLLAVTVDLKLWGVTSLPLSVDNLKKFSSFCWENCVLLIGRNKTKILVMDYL